MKRVFSSSPSGSGSPFLASYGRHRHGRGSSCRETTPSTMKSHLNFTVGTLQTTPAVTSIAVNKPAIMMINAMIFTQIRSSTLHIISGHAVFQAHRATTKLILAGLSRVPLNIIQIAIKMTHITLLVHTMMKPTGENISAATQLHRYKKWELFDFSCLSLSGLGYM